MWLTCLGGKAGFLLEIVYEIDKVIITYADKYTMHYRCKWCKITDHLEKL